MKFLTAVTIILMIPTLIASIYGMNVKLPFQGSPHAFLITLGISLTLSVIGVLIFIKRKWFWLCFNWHRTFTMDVDEATCTALVIKPKIVMSMYFKKKEILENLRKKLKLNLMLKVYF